MTFRLPAITALMLAAAACTPAKEDDSIDPQGKTFAAPPAADHLPITLVEPFETNRSVLGLDVLVLPATSEAVMATRIAQCL